MKRIIEGVLMLLIQVAFGLYLAGACLLLDDNTKGWCFVVIATVIAVPVVILLNLKEETE